MIAVQSFSYLFLLSGIETVMHRYWRISCIIGSTIIYSKSQNLMQDLMFKKVVTSAM